MKSFWLGLLSSFVGVMLLGAMAFYTDVFTIDRDGAPKFRVSDAGKITVGATESYVNLVIPARTTDVVRSGGQNNGVAPTNKVDIMADVLTVEGIRLESVNVTADITVSGAGGLPARRSAGRRAGGDTGSEAAGTWYYVWAITNNDGTSSSGLLSASSTSPTMPSGFTKKRRVGAVRNDGSSNFLQFAQEGNRCNYLNPLLANRIVSDGLATTFTAISAATFVPPTSRRGIFGILSNVNHNAAGTSFTVRTRKTGSGALDGQAYCSHLTKVANVSSIESAIGECETNESQQIDYMLDILPTSGGANIDVLGYYDRI